MVLTQTFLYRIFTMQSFKSYSSRSMKTYHSRRVLANTTPLFDLVDGGLCKGSILSCKISNISSVLLFPSGGNADGTVLSAVILLDSSDCVLLDSSEAAMVLDPLTMLIQYTIFWVIVHSLLRGGEGLTQWLVMSGHTMR